MVKSPPGSAKIITMLLIFGLVALFSLISYFILLHTRQSVHNTKVPPHLTSPKKSTLQHPKEYSDDNLRFFYPDTFNLDIASSGAMTWKAKLPDGSFMPNAITLKSQTTPFPEPSNMTNDPAFAVDDKQGRVINGIEVMEYTIHCSYRCSRREDQFKINNSYYQLTFDVILPGFSEQAELILNTLSSKAITPSPSQQPQGKMCTLEAKLCPDGSSVGRTGPNCEFAACPK
jgi:hypothetical protein